MSRDSGEDGETSVSDRRDVGVGPRSQRKIRIVEGALAAVIFLALALVAMLLTLVGREGREWPVPSERRVVIVRTSADLLAELEASGVRGATLVYLSRFLHFVPVARAVPADALRIPVETFDLGEAHVSRVDPKNVLWLALESGVAREVVHVLPAEDYFQKRQALSAGGADIWFEHDRVVTHSTGSRRTIADSVPLDRLDGPFMVAVDASYLDGESPGDVDTVLATVDLESVPIILNRAEDNPDVSDFGRRRLDLLALQRERAE